MKKRYLIPFSPLLLAFCMGSTDCEAYDDVTVPASDPNPPVNYDGVYDPGEAEYADLVSTSQALTYHLPAGADPVIAVASGMDPGGVKKIEMLSEFSYTCCKNHVCSATQSINAIISDTQPGTVGSTVSNGLWTGTEVDLPTCNPTYTLGGFTFKWTSRATNFHGGVTVSAARRIVYP